MAVSMRAAGLASQFRMKREQGSLAVPPLPSSRPAPAAAQFPQQTRHKRYSALEPEQ